MMDRLKGVVRRWAGGGSTEAFTRSPVTTEQDVWMCFRLLLGREPNPEEWSGHAAQAERPLAPVVAGYLNSLEFARRGLMRPDPAMQPRVAEMGGYGVYAMPDDIQVGRHVLEGRYEAEVEAVFRAVLRPGMGVVDIGANIGVFSMLSAQLVGASGAVLAIEPNPANVRLIEASRRLNGFDQMTVLQMGAGRRPGLLALNTTHSNGTTSEPDGALEQLLQAQTVACMPVDALVGASWPPGRRVDLIKVDVEGAEYNALLGASEVIARDRPVIVTEFSPTFMPGISGVDGPEYLAWLFGQGYAVSVIRRDGAPVEVGQDGEAVMAAFWERNTDHIDLLARPIERTRAA